MCRKVVGTFCLVAFLTSMVAGGWLLGHRSYLEVEIPGLLCRMGMNSFYVAKHYHPEQFGRLYLAAVVASASTMIIATAGWWRRDDLSQAILGARTRLVELLRHRSYPAGDTRLWRIDCVCGIVLLAVGMGIMILGAATLPIRCDEAGMYNSVCSSRLPVWLVAYIAPNNHVGLSGFLWLGHFAWGDSILGMRVFSLFAWLVMTWALMQIEGEVFGSESLSVIALGMTIPAVLGYSFMARGYALSSALVALSLLIVLRAREWKGLAVGALAGAAAMWVVPTACYFIVVVCGVLLWKRRQRSSLARAMGCVVAYGAATILFALLLYLPIIACSGWQNLTANRLIISHPLEWVVARYPGWLVRNVQMSLAGSVAACFLPIGLLQHLFSSSRKSATTASTPQLLPYLACAVLAMLTIPLVQRALPVVRCLTLLFPLLLVLLLPRLGKWRMAYAAGALIATALLLARGTDALCNDKEGIVDNASTVAVRIAESPHHDLQTNHAWAYNCVRFYLWRTIPDATVGCAQYDDDHYTSYWVLKHDPGKTPRGYVETEIPGLFRKASLD